MQRSREETLCERSTQENSLEITQAPATSVRDLWLASSALIEHQRLWGIPDISRGALRGLLSPERARVALPQLALAGLARHNLNVSNDTQQGGIIQVRVARLDLDEASTSTLMLSSKGKVEVKELTLYTKKGTEQPPILDKSSAQLSWGMCERMNYAVRLELVARLQAQAGPGIIANPGDTTFLPAVIMNGYREQN